MHARIIKRISAGDSVIRMIKLMSPNLFVSGTVGGFVTDTVDEAGATMTGAESWIQIELCNPEGHCCKSSPMYDRQERQWVAIASDNQCHGFALHTKPVGTQTYILSHHGPDDITLSMFRIHLNGGTLFHCKASDGDGRIALSSSTVNKMSLSCKAEFKFE